MSFNTFGKIFRFTTWGESHGPAIGCVVDGCPPNISISEKDIMEDMNRRRPGKSKFTSQRKESDKVDTWKLICNDFLDTELETTDIQRNQETLGQLGFSFAEIQAIRKKITWTLFGTMEWNYLGLWDLLAMKQNRSLIYSLTGRDYYWWTMKNFI